MNLYQMPEAHLIAFAFVFLRVIAFLFSSAVFSSQTITVPLKILFGLILSILVFSFVEPKLNYLEITKKDILTTSLLELIVGLSMGFVSRFFFFVVNMVGSLISVLIGLSSAQLFNPMLGEHGNSFEQFYTVLATLIFFSLNGHHVLLMGIHQSFDLIPLSEGITKPLTLRDAVYLFSEMLEISIRIAAPVMVAALLANIGLAILGRAVPQLNILVTSFPVLVFAGFFVMMITLPLFAEHLSQILEKSLENYVKFIKAV